MSDQHSFTFGTKAETLLRLRQRLTTGRVPRLLYFRMAEWEVSEEEILRRIAQEFPDDELIIRSSSSHEDGSENSMAGYFVSIPSVSSTNPEQLRRAISSIAASYTKRNGGDIRSEQILVQRMVSNISMSGVLFTKDMNTGAPYYSINYDDQTGRTDTVSSGTGYYNRTLYVLRNAVGALASGRFRTLLAAVEEIEEITGNDCLDIEFGVDFDLTVHIFQVRQITSQANWDKSLPGLIEKRTDELRAFFRGNARPHPGICGQSPIYGRMPDWNPAEIIGACPHPLAYSLYQHLITDHAWNEARSLMGYKPPTGQPLMVSFAGQPFIDVRLSFHSFLPASLPHAIGDKLVTSWVHRLQRHPHLHDKIEFDIAFTTLDFSTIEEFDLREGDTLSKRERFRFLTDLGELTNRLLTGEVADPDGQMRLVEELAGMRDGLSDCDDFSRQLEGLIKICISHGTIPFSILARHAFIAMSFLRSLVKLGIFTPREAEQFQKSIPTVASDFLRDLNALGSKEMSLDAFLKLYGHLRPGTYDILSPRYDKRADLLQSLSASKAVHQAGPTPFRMSGGQEKEINAALKRLDYGLDAQELLAYISRCIQYRESSKFLFTSVVSDIIEHIAAWGAEQGLSLNDLSFLRLPDVLAPGSGSRLIEQSRRNAREYTVTKALLLPFLIAQEQDIVIAPHIVGQPNYVTSKRVEGPIVELKNFDSLESLKGRIVFIESADPGYDWIFAGDILGVVTKYGGTNSHMAIRCAEFGLPAAFGCGEQIYERLCKAKGMVLDCASKQLTPVY